MKNNQITLHLFLVVVTICGIAIGVIRNNKYEKTQTAQEKTLDLNFYQNLHEQRDVNALIIGDSIGQSSGSSNSNEKWFNIIMKDVKQKYKSTITTDLITGGSTTGIRGWVELNNAKLTKKYDVAFICFGENDQGTSKPEQFRIFYESIIIKLKKINPNIDIIPIIESSFREYNDYSNVIKELSKHYNLQYADTIQAFNRSEQPYSNLSKDGVHPNDKGYSYYVATIEKIINANYISNKKTGINYNVLYNGTNKLTDFVFDISPDSNNGFILGNGMIGNKVGNAITFNINRSVAIIHYLGQPNGGRFKVFFDDNFIKEINTNLAFQVSYSSLISDNLDGQHKIKIEISSINKGGTVKILGLATN